MATPDILFGELVVVKNERALPGPSQIDQMQIWAQAFETWLSPKAANTQRAYRQAWNDLLQFTGKQPWVIGKADVQLWAEDMRGRGLSDCTQAQRIAGISSFYDFAGNDYTVIRADGKEVPLHSTNPAGGKRLRPKIKPYGKARFLDSTRVKSLLKAIPANSLQRLRDRALFLGYIFTGRRNSEWRTMTWGQMFESEGKVFYRWSGKNTQDAINELPDIVWKAVLAYLKAAGKLETIQEGDYLFTALSDHAKRLPNVGEAFDGSRPLSMRQVGSLLKHYLKKAGIDGRKIKVHSLRHSAVMLRKKAGDDLMSLMNFAGHKQVSTTQIYLHMEGVADESWTQVAGMLGLDLGAPDKVATPNKSHGNQA